jgi:hypothetical protein
MRRLILRLLTPLQRIAQRIGNPEPRITTRFADSVLQDLQNGDLLLSREEWKITNPFVPGFWGHAAIYYNGQIVEAVGDYKDEETGRLLNGVRFQDPRRWLFQKDHVAHLRLSLPQKERNDIGIVAHWQQGKRYDYSFWPNADEFYCSELFVYAHNVVAWYDKITLPQDTITPQNLYEMRGRLELLREEIN